MVYLPKSKTEIKIAKKGELVFVDNLTPFTGQYIETSTGKLYAGTNNLSLVKELKPTPPKSIRDNLYEDEKSINVQRHNILKQQVNNFTNNTLSIQGSKPQPTEKDYQKGYYSRYFTKRINSFNYKEINKDNFDSISAKEGKYDHHLNEIGKLNWHLTGNVFKKNTTSLKLINKIFPNIQNLFPIINEYYRSDSTEVLQNNLHTTGKELYYSDSKEYIGLYHIHPEKGPMVGAEHSSTSHAKLYYSSQLPNKNSFNIFDLVKSTTSKPGLDKPTISTNDRIVRSPSTPPPPPSIPSSGGGGGY
jgi:hypothetical protein|tara:strand:+ start:593 stop:1501 length:909 start_codon:yes stop_codon:yes gene_type:complete